MANRNNNIPSQMILLIIIVIIIGCGNPALNSPCDGIICINESTCNNGICECSVGYEGDNCEIRLYLIKTVYINNSVYQTFEYDEQNRILKKTQSEINNHPYDYNYFYDLDTTLVKIVDLVSFDTITYHFFIDTHEEKLYFIYNKDKESEIKSIYSNHDLNCGYSYGEIFHQFPNLFQYQEINYQENCGMTIKGFSASTELLNSTIEIFMDDSRFIHQSENLIGLDPNFAFITNKKNFQEVTFENGDQIVEENISYESIFTLNNNDFPIMEIREYKNGITDKFIFEYY